MICDRYDQRIAGRLRIHLYDMKIGSVMDMHRVATAGRIAAGKNICEISRWAGGHVHFSRQFSCLNCETTGRLTD